MNNIRIFVLPDMIAILHNIRSAHNVGSIFRTADAAGVEKIYLCGYTPGPRDPLGKLRQPFAKVSLGAESTVPYEFSKSTTHLLDKLKKQGYTIYAVEQHKKSIRYDKVKPPAHDRVAIVMGNELEGLSPAILRRADHILEIPMRGQKESLNVSVAFGIITYQLLST